MTKEIDEFIKFLMEKNEDERIEIDKEIKYGHKNYFITFDIDDDPNGKQNQWSKIKGRITIHFDTRNECVVVTTDYSSLIFEEKDLLEKWCPIIEEYLKSNLLNNFNKLVDKSLSDCFKKDIYRDWQMRKIIEDDESI
jgi:hypothetical protein